MSIRRFACLLTVFITISSLVGCMSMQSKSDVTLNPDLSGKCTYEIKMGRDLAGILTTPSENLYSGFGMSGTGTSKNSQDPAMALASKILSSGKIDAWKDVQFGYIKTDTVFFKGTAYFKDITKMAVSMFDSTLNVHRDADGNIVLEITEQKKKKDSSSSIYSGSSYDSIGKNMFKNVGFSDIMHYYFASLVRGLDVSTTYHLPGKIIMYSNFKKINDNTISISLTGNDVIKLLDSLSGRGDYSSEMYSKYYSAMGLKDYGGSGGGENGSYFYNKILYGEDKPVMAVFKAESKMAFDYAKEVAEAKVYYTKFRKTSGIEKFDSVQAEEKKIAEEEKIKEQGTLVLTAADSANNKIYFKSLTATQYSGVLSFTGILSRPVGGAYFSKIILTKALADNGANVCDTIIKQNNYSYTTDTAQSYLNAYLSPSNYLSSGHSDSLPSNDKVTFSLVASNLPADVKFINLEGFLEVDENTHIPFKIVNLFIKQDDYKKGWK